MKISPEEYDQARAWFCVVWESLRKHAGLLDKHSPISALDGIAATSPSKARQGLSMAISDIFSLMDSWPDTAVTELEAQLAEASLPRFADMRLRFDRAIRNIVRRGQIRNEREYYAIRNVIGTVRPNETILSELLADFERRTMP